jgi:hypothetical protein
MLVGDHRDPGEAAKDDGADIRTELVAVHDVDAGAAQASQDGHPRPDVEATAAADAR